MKEDYLTPTQLARMMGLSRQAVIDKIKKGLIDATKVGHQYIIDKKELESLKKKGYSLREAGVKRSARSTDDRQSVLKMVRDNDINTIQLWFVDILGVLKCVSITARDLEEAI